MKDLTHAAVSKRSDIALWRALALAQQGKWVEAREGFRTLETASATLPLEMQRFAFQEAARAAVEVRDFGGAASLINEFDTLGSGARARRRARRAQGARDGRARPPRRGAHALSRGRRDRRDRPAAARGRLREIALRQSIGEIKREEATAALETLTTAGAATRPRPRRCSCSGALRRGWTLSRRVPA